MLCSPPASSRALGVAQVERARRQRRAMTVPSAGAAASGDGPQKSEKLFSFGLLSDVQVGGGERQCSVIMWRGREHAGAAGTCRHRLAAAGHARRPSPSRPPARPGPPASPIPSFPSQRSIQTRRTAPASTARHATTATRCSSWTGRSTRCAARAWPARCTWVRGCWRWVRSAAWAGSGGAAAGARPESSRACILACGSVRRAVD